MAFSKGYTPWNNGKKAWNNGLKWSPVIFSLTQSMIRYGDLEEHPDKSFRQKHVEPATRVRLLKKKHLM
jgi:hypothetical protein